MGLIEQWQEGDIAAFETLFLRYKEMVIRTALSIVADEDEAEDVLQTAFFRAVRDSLPDVSEDKASVIATSLLLDEFYHKKGRPGIGFSYEVHEAWQDGLPRWELKLGAWLILADNAAELQHFADVLQQLRVSPAYDVDLDALDKAERRVSKAVADFQASLAPDAQLRKLVLNGRCNSCP